MRRVALVTNVMAHYRVRCFEQLSSRLEGRLDLFLLASDMPHRSYVLAKSADAPKSVVLKSLRFSRGEHDNGHLSDLRPVIFGGCDTLILGGWDEPSYLALWAYAALARKRLFFWIESTERDAIRSPKKELIKRALLAAAEGCIVPGRRAAEYCASLGVAPDRIHVAPNATDGATFSARARSLAPERASLRARLGVEGFAVLFAGRLVEAMKNVSTLIQAMAELDARGVRATLLIAGDGPDRSAYEELARSRRLSRVRFLGTLDHAELARFYAVADVFVLPSRSEPWGFVLNEAMEFGLPLVVSDAVGAAPDLVCSGANGFVHAAGDHRLLAAHLQELARDETRRLSMGAESRSIISRFTPERWADGVFSAVSS